MNFIYDHPHLIKHLNLIRAHFNQTCKPLTPISRYYRKLIAGYYARYIRPSVKVIEIGCGNAELLSLLPYKNPVGIDLAENQIKMAKNKIPEGTFILQAGESPALEGQYDEILISDTLNYAGDIQMLLNNLHLISKQDSRLLINTRNTLWAPIIRFSQKVKLKNPEPQLNWLSVTDVLNLLHLSDWEPITIESRILLPLPYIGPVINRWLAPLLQHFCLTTFIICRQRIPVNQRQEYSVTVIVPARNEAGNIPEAIKRIPIMGLSTEVIFVEGNSTDDTWIAIQKTLTMRNDLSVKAMKQSAKGKANAVREAIECAAGDIIMILDADLTVAPEELPKFYELLATHKAEFANGVRLVYPMENHAMRFLNMCANKFFSIGFSWILAQPVKDTLCGTKVFFRKPYLEFTKTEEKLRQKDPFGDFEFLYFARKNNLKILDLPIRYHDRVYGETNINRWKHGWMLLKMLVYGALRFKFI